MGSSIDPETLYVDELPGIWSPVQWELNDEERIQELEDQATASLLWSVDAPEAILRLLLAETAIQRAYSPPPGYNPDQQGEWNDDLVTFQFTRTIDLINSERSRERLYLEYKVEDQGYWAFEITPERVTLERI